MEYLIAAGGGALGSLVRFILGRRISEKAKTNFPISTFFINITGAILLGIVSSLGLKANMYTLFGDGFLGAYTTFSTFMYEGFNLFQEAEKLNAFIYILASLILGIIGFISGVEIARYIKLF